MTDFTCRATILIPTHDRATTLRLAVTTAVSQTVEDLEVIILGDGVTDRVRATARALAKSDSRVVFFDRPKSRNHGEEYRHEAIVAARSNAIFYLCDDDLLLPQHVEDLLGLLGEFNFVQSLNGYIRTTGALEFYPGILSDPETIYFHVKTRDWTQFFNSVSLTGTAHSRDFYLMLDRPWETTPTGRYPDHFQWCKMLDSPQLRAASSTRMTALQFPGHRDGRDALSEKERLAELRRWARIVASPDGQARIDELVRLSAPVQMDRDLKIIYELRQALHSARVELHQMSQTLSWRTTSPLRRIRALTRRRR
ncbi:MAG: glycosyltransferase [Actinobacteria bacterium]|uniref:Unannotated protein n=1 Tax=freshwater metagenome TaxID=449393 RepID=A0A6J7FL03_9ZZZZ|nr:glycosyltransferase [Actinomycetota bacterium]